MAKIDFSTAQIIVENAMRKNNYGGKFVISGQTMDFESAWKSVSPVNYQTLRDAIAKSIVDALTAIEVSGSISNGNLTAPDGQVVVTSPDVNINTNDPLKGAARLGDSVTTSLLTDPIFIAWMQAVGSFCSIPSPITVSSKISSSSGTVRIGD